MTDETPEAKPKKRVSSRPKKVEKVRAVPSSKQRRAAILHGLDYDEYMRLHPDESDADGIIEMKSCRVKH